ncbi:MAG: methanethiol S-methyltransferase [Pseudomonadota bacterium]
MKRTAILLYGAFAYVLFLAVFAYMAGFLLNIGVPKAINDGTSGAPMGLALSINFALIFLFGFTHSLMARDWFKRGLTRLISPAAERSTFVLQSSLFLALAMWQWQPLDMPIWQLEGPWVWIGYAAFGFGAGIVLLSTFLIDHFELFGLRQIWMQMRGKEMPVATFRTPMLYQMVRHPMQLGVMILVFATPVMTVGHMIFACAMTAYIFVGLYFEERALLREFGSDYAAYKQRVPMLIPNLRGATRVPIPAE